MRKNKNTSKIILALIVAFLAMAGSYSGFKNMNSELEEKNRLIQLMQTTNKPKDQGDYAYAVAKINLKAGEIISDEDVDFQSFTTINTSAFDNRSNVVNKILLKDINSGDVFTNAHIAQISSDDLTLKEGYRALTLPMSNFQGQSASMTLGSYVDIYSMSPESDWASEKTKIIGIDGGSSASGTGAKVADKGLLGASTVTFEVSTNDLSDFISNVAKGNLILVARNQNDKKIVHRKSKAPKIDIGSMGNFSPSSIPTLPNFPASSPEPVSNLSGLPQPVSPVNSSSSVEVIEANVKSQVTFD